MLSLAILMGAYMLTIKKEIPQLKEKAINKRAKKKLKEIVIHEKWCKACGICVDICPKHVLEMDFLVAKVVRPDDCILCGRCEMACPDFCIQVITDDESNQAAG